MSLQAVPMDIVQANEIAIGETLRSAEIARTQVLEGYQQQAETMRALFQKMQQTIEQQAAENAALKVSLVAAETKNREAETVYKHEVEALKKLVGEAAHQDRLHKEETGALKKLNEELKSKITQLAKDANGLSTRLSAEVTRLSSIDIQFNPEGKRPRASLEVHIKGTNGVISNVKAKLTTIKAALTSLR